MTSDTPTEQTPEPATSPQWTRTTKTIVVVVFLLLVALVAWRFQGLIGQIVTAAVLAYVVNPLVKFVDENTPLRRSTLILIVYFVLILLLIGAFTALGVAAYGQIQNLISQSPELINELVSLVRRWTENPVIVFGPLQFSLGAFDWASIRQQLLGLVEPILSRSGQYAGVLATTTVRTVGNFLFIWVISIYLALEIPQLGNYLRRAARQPGYRGDVDRLIAEFSRIWSAYLRGQIVLGLIIGVTVGVSLGILGVQNALALGILSGLLEFIPILGPLIGAGAAVIVAFFQPENYLGLTSFQLALAVLAVMFAIQQLENNILVPRIVGNALDLHALVVIIGVFMGGSLAGILGAILAAPVLATLKLLGTYAWRKLFDLPPFPEEIDKPPGGDGSLWQRLKAAWSRRRGDGAQAEPEPDALES